MMKEIEKFEGDWATTFKESECNPPDYESMKDFDTFKLRLYFGRVRYHSIHKGPSNSKGVVLYADLDTFLCKIHDNIVTLPWAEGTVEYSLDGDAEKITWSNGAVWTVQSDIKLKRRLAKQASIAALVWVCMILYEKSTYIHVYTHAQIRSLCNPSLPPCLALSHPFLSRVSPSLPPFSLPPFLIQNDL